MGFKSFVVVVVVDGGQKQEKREEPMPNAALKWP